MDKMRVFAVCFVLMLSTLAAFTSCDKDNEFQSLPAAVQTCFRDKYPDAKFKDWELEGRYYVLEFRNDGREAEAWFDVEGWLMTETDVRRGDLPEAVSTAFEASEYAKWRIDDIDKIERAYTSTFYVIEVEQKEAEAEIYYLPDGKLVRTGSDLNNGNNSYLPELPTAAKQFLDEKYPNALVVDFDYGQNGFEVDIFYDDIKREVTFTKDLQWQHTSWEIAENQLPTAVATFLNSNYANHKIDDIEFVDSADNDYYAIELKKGGQEITVNVLPDGNRL